MCIKQRGFTLIIVLTILGVLSLVVMATFEQAQWVKRSGYFVWQQVKMQDRVWQQLTLAEEQLRERAVRGKCVMPYSLANEYFFVHKSTAADCVYQLNDQQIGVAYELIASDLCAQIRNSTDMGVDFFRVTIQSLASSSGQKMVLQSIVVLSVMDKNRTDGPSEPMTCIKNELYHEGRQSWLLQ